MRDDHTSISITSNLNDGSDWVVLTYMMVHFEDTSTLSKKDEKVIRFSSKTFLEWMNLEKSKNPK